MRRLLPLCFIAMLLGAQTPPPAFDPDTLLAQVRQKMNRALDGLPRYLCTETIDRTVSRPATPDGNVAPCEKVERLREKKGWHARPHTSDRLRLDVAVLSHTETYSWAGENHFDERSLSDLVRSGATSTGAFASFLSAIFQSDAAEFSYAGESGTGDKRLVEFAFRVPLERSRYKVGDREHHAIVPYHGNFLIDPATFDVARLTVYVDVIPPKISACDISNTLTYGDVPLNGSEFVLPASVTFRVVRTDGSELENRTVFTGCHRFTGESSLRFDDPTPDPAAAREQHQVEARVIPPQRSFTVELTQPIHTARAAAGDAVVMILRTAIKGKDHRVIVPVGSIVRGRIVQMQRIYGGDFDSVLLAIRLDTIEIAGVVQPFYARLDSVLKGRQRATHESAMSVDESLLEDTIAASEMNAGTLRFETVNDDYVIPRGTWLAGSTSRPH